MAKEKKQGVIVVGELNVDLIMNRAEQFPELDKEILAEEMTFTMGSSAAIFASNLSTVGTDVYFIGKVGRDMFGDFMISSLNEGGVNSGEVIRSENFRTGITVILNYGESSAKITYTGAMDDLVLWDISESALQKGEHLHVSSIFLQKGLKGDVTELFRKARELGMTTSLDPQWDPAEKWDIPWSSLLPYVDLFIPNRNEILNLTGMDDLEAAVDRLKPHANAIIVKDGGKGAHLFSDDQYKFQEAFRVSDVVDSIGAGDSFNAGFVHSYVSGRSLEECLEYGALCGAMNTQRAGGTGAFKEKSEFEKIAREDFNYRL